MQALKNDRCEKLEMERIILYVTVTEWFFLIHLEELRQ